MVQYRQHDHGGKFPPWHDAIFLVYLKYGNANVFKIDLYLRLFEG